MDNQKDMIKKRQAEVDKNYEAFKEMFDDIVISHRNEYALMKGGEIRAYFSTFNDAISAGDIAFPDKMYSVQKVEKKPVDLGYFSHA